MTSRVLRASDTAGEQLGEGIGTIQQQLHVEPTFPDEVERAAQAAAAAPRLPDLDLTDLDFVTIDPEGSRDLDQAMHLERDGDGYVVHYAIADLTAFITPGDPLDVEANRRGETLYGAGGTVPLHPLSLSEGAASLLPGELRPAYCWTLRLDAKGELVEADVRRARVRSRRQLDYAGVQRALDDGSADLMLQLLREIGRLRVEEEIDRGGVNLPMPEQEVTCTDGVCRLDFRDMLEVEEWNAQISLLTGFAAASMMMHGRIGVLRTLPPPEPDAIKRLHRTAKGLGLSWPAEQLYPDFIRALDPAKPAEAAMVVACTSLLRGAAYVGFNGETPAQPEHAALASEYAHVTAPLRRLVDRYGLEVCAALCAGEDVPMWVVERLHELPETMQRADRLAHQYESAVRDLVEAQTLRSRVGEVFDAVVLDVHHDDPSKGQVMLREPAVEASVTGSQLPVGEQIRVRLVEADPATRVVRFEAADA